MRNSRLFVFSSVVLLSAAMLNAQVAGKVTGSVVDPAGAVVPGATVTLQLPGTNAPLYSTKTTAGGDFTLPTVNAGTYDLAIEARGFVKMVLSNVKVDAERSTDVPPVKL